MVSLCEVPLRTEHFSPGENCVPTSASLTGISRRLDAMLFRIPFRAAIICGALILLGPTAFSQARIGSVQGVVKDPNGALVPNATVTVTQPVTGYKQSATTDAQGAYRIVNVPFNTYTVRAEAAGFQSAEQHIDLEAAVPLTVDFNMTVGAAAESVTVTA